MKECQADSPVGFRKTYDRVDSNVCGKSSKS